MSTLSVVPNDHKGRGINAFLIAFVYAAGVLFTLAANASAVLPTLFIFAISVGGLYTGQRAIVYWLGIALSVGAALPGLLNHGPLFWPALATVLAVILVFFYKMPEIDAATAAAKAAAREKEGQN